MLDALINFLKTFFLSSSVDDIKEKVSESVEGALEDVKDKVSDMENNIKETFQDESESLMSDVKQKIGLEDDIVESDSLEELEELESASLTEPTEEAEEEVTASGDYEEYSLLNSEDEFIDNDTYAAQVADGGDVELEEFVAKTTPGSADMEELVEIMGDEEFLPDNVEEFASVAAEDDQIDYISETDDGVDLVNKNDEDMEALIQEFENVEDDEDGKGYVHTTKGSWDSQV